MLPTIPARRTPARQHITSEERSSLSGPFFLDVRDIESIMDVSVRAIGMLDDYKYSIGRLVVYKHPDPRLPRQSYGQYGHERTVGEITAVDVVRSPHPHWVYTIRNIRNQQVANVSQDQIEFATTGARRWKKSSRRSAEQRVEDGALAEMIARALSSPGRQNLLRSTLRDLLYREEIEAKVQAEGARLPLHEGDYIRVRGDLRKETAELHNHYAKVISTAESDIAGIENPESKPDRPRLYRTLRKFRVVSSEGVEADIYDAEVKLFYTANGRKTILNWRAATLLAEAFGDEPPYKLEFEYLADHIFTRDELKGRSRADLVELLGTLLYVKGRMGWRDYQRRGQILGGLPRIQLIDSILDVSRFDSRRNRLMTGEEIANRQKDYFRLRRLLKSG